MPHPLPTLTLLLGLVFTCQAQVKYLGYEPKINDVHFSILKIDNDYDFKWQSYLLPAGCAIIAGGFQGLNETLSHHYAAFQRVHPNANADWWDPRKSWPNKWELDANGQPISGNERFWLSSSAFVMFTDGYHATDSGNYAFLNLSYLFLPQGNKPFIIKLAEVAGIWICRKVGFHLVYTYIYRT